MKLKNILKEAINEMGYNDIHFKNIFQHWQSADALNKEKISSLITGSPNSSEKEIIQSLLDMGHEEIQDLEKEFGIDIKETTQQK
jgi:hypothetical protein